MVDYWIILNIYIHVLLVIINSLFIGHYKSNYWNKRIIIECYGMIWNNNLNIRLYKKMSHTCEFCNKNFTQRYNMLKHQKKSQVLFRYSEKYQIT